MTRLLLVALLVFAAGCTKPESPRPSQDPAPAIPTSLGTLPEISVSTLDGREAMTDQLTGDVVLVNFRAMWCAPCHRETPALVALQEEMADRDFRVIGISMDDADDTAVRAFGAR